MKSGKCLNEQTYEEKFMTTFNVVIMVGGQKIRKVRLNKSQGKCNNVSLVGLA